MPHPTVDTGKSFHRLFKGPIDKDLIFTTYELAIEYIENPNSSAYHGQLISVSGIDNKSSAYRVDTDGSKLVLSPIITANNITLFDAIASGGVLNGVDYPDLNVSESLPNVISRINELTNVLTNSVGTYNHEGILESSEYPDLPPSADITTVINRINSLTNALKIT